MEKKGLHGSNKRTCFVTRRATTDDSTGSHRTGPIFQALITFPCSFARPRLNYRRTAWAVHTKVFAEITTALGVMMKTILRSSPGD